MGALGKFVVLPLAAVPPPREAVIRRTQLGFVECASHNPDAQWLKIPCQYEK